MFAQPGVKKRAAKSFRLEQQTGPAAVWQAKVVDVAVGTDRRPRHRLNLRVQLADRGEKILPHQLATTHRPASCAAGRVRARRNVEHVFRVAKSEVGLTHFEGRSYVSFETSLALCW